jgi:hypothetical protein
MAGIYGNEIQNPGVSRVFLGKCRKRLCKLRQLLHTLSNGRPFRRLAKLHFAAMRISNAQGKEAGTGAANK